ncbi:protein bride of sevenless-like isoform X2 [Eriocheir sinensis]|uniref:protein bride of sevenless-like isoform X2 n=1 Tax=Eriocheir sinensis TaxID=95602 RepID=UPI0021C6CFB1|nr:protein bride of sevenless-like isoform X2 [Eriocheir sinensis]
MEGLSSFPLLLSNHSFNDDLSRPPHPPPPGEGMVPPANTSAPTMGYLRSAPWVVPLLAASATNAAAIVAFEVYVVVRAVHGTPSRRHLFLGQSLLMGLLLASLTGVPVALTPTPLTCGATRLLAGVSGALVFGVLLVKCVFLVSLNSGVYLPAHYQALLLFFIVLVTINLQWQWSQPAGVAVVREGGGAGLLQLSCMASYRQVLLSLIYVILLLVVVAAMAVKCRSIRENYREAAYIGAALGLVLPLWLAWTLAGLIVPPSLQPPCLGFGLVATATIVFVVMFIPKGRQLAAMGKEGVFREDQEDHLSTISGGGGRYSPSFFHFKPIKTAKDILSHHQPASLYKTRLSGVGRGDDGVYTTIDPPTPYPPAASNPNFYLFRSHAHTGMMY